jgi:hypothetical protein
MERNFHMRSTAQAATLPSEATIFACALLGKPVPNVSTSEADARAEREHSEWLAAISPEYERRLRHAQLQNADAREAQELEEFVRAITGVDEGTWDPAKHPRTGTAPNRGYWAPTDGSGSNGGPSDGDALPSSGSADHHGVKATFVSQKSDSSATQQQGAAPKEQPVQPVQPEPAEPPVATKDNVLHHGGTPEQHERFHKLLDELANDHETVAGSLARTVKDATKTKQFHVHWTDGPTQSTRGGPGGAKSGEKLGISLDKNHPSYVANPDEVELDGVDPDKAAKIVLGHELGHTMLNLQDPTPQNRGGGNVTLIENPLRKRLGVKERQKYNGLQVPDPLGPGNHDLKRLKAHEERERNEHKKQRK